MFPLFLKYLSFFPSSSSQFRKVFTRFKVSSSSSSSSSFPVVSVWWHLDSCPVPPGVSYSKVAPSITAALRANGIMGNIHIRVYGDFNSSEVDKEALNSTNISLYGSVTGSSFVKQKVNTVGNNNTYKYFLMDLNDWVSTNPPPIHVFLIFGNEEFSSSGILHRLRMCNYNILLACPGMPHVALCHAATIMWEWSSLLNGEDLTGTHFNYPPDGPTKSCYGNSNVPLENPFSLVDLHTSSHNVDIKLDEASKSVSREVMKILCSHPNGISMGDLRAELIKCDLSMDKRLYGNKKFSNFLVSISYIQLEYLGGGNFWVRLVPSTTSVVKNKQKDGAATQKLHNEDLSHPPKPDWDKYERVLVWWDFDSCGVPSDISFLNVAPSIMGVLRANGIKDPIHIDAYGDVSQFSKIEQEALLLSGIDLHHIPGGKNKNKCFVDWLSQIPSSRFNYFVSGGKNKNKCFVDWLSQIPSCTYLFLISGDDDFDFSDTVHWKCKWINLFLACPGKVDGYVCKAATIVWQWSSVLKGKYLTGKYFDLFGYRDSLKYPPEWYRNSKVPHHENPFSAAEESTTSQNAKILQPSSYKKLIYVPKDVSWKVVKVLSSYPNGISIEDLKFQLRYYCFGHGLPDCKKLSNILASIPDVQLLYIGDDNFCVRLIPSTTSNVKKKNEQRVINHSGKRLLFYGDFFWGDMESFVFSSRGSRLLSRSKSREDLAHRLQKHRPLYFEFFTENKIFQVVKLLIEEKKWLEESPTQAFPFRVTKSVQKP